MAFDVPNITNISLSDFEERNREILADKDVEMVCKVGKFERRRFLGKLQIQ